MKFFAKGILVSTLLLSYNLYASDAKLLTPGPLSTTTSVKQAMMHDLGSRDSQFTEISERVRNKLCKLARKQDTHVVVPMQGSGTFSVEAMIGTLLPKEGKALILSNGSYGNRLAKITEAMDRDFTLASFDETQAYDLEKIENILKADSSISHIAMVHCETSTGRLNPIHAVSKLAKQYDKDLLIDAMSSFGGVELGEDIEYAALVSSANKCMQGVPGFAYCIVNQEKLKAAKGNAHSLSLDLQDQWHFFETKQQWRFTPPVQAVLALDQALTELEQEGGIQKRQQRYAQNCAILDQGIQALGFKRFLSDEDQSPIILTYHISNSDFDFDSFYQSMKKQGFIIYPGKATQLKTFRIGCIGNLDAKDVNLALTAFENSLNREAVAHSDMPINSKKG